MGFNTEIFSKKLREGCASMFEMLEDGRTLYADEELLALVNKEFLCIRRRFKKDGKHGSRSHKPPLTAKRKSQSTLEKLKTN